MSYQSNIAVGNFLQGMRQAKEKKDEDERQQKLLKAQQNLQTLQFENAQITQQQQKQKMEQAQQQAMQQKQALAQKKQYMEALQQSDPNAYKAMQAAQYGAPAAIAEAIMGGGQGQPDMKSINVPPGGYSVVYDPRTGKPVSTFEGPAKTEAGQKPFAVGGHVFQPGTGEFITPPAKPETQKPIVVEPGKQIYDPKTKTFTEVPGTPTKKDKTPEKMYLAGEITYEKLKEVKQAGKVGTEKPSLSEEAINQQADRLIATGKMASFGMGGIELRTKILNRAAERTKALGDSPQAQVQRQAMLAANTQELKRIQSQRGPVMAFKKTVERNLSLVREAGGELKRTGVPIVNKWINVGRRAVMGNPQIAKFDLALRTVINEFARVTTSATGGGVTSDTARREIESLLNDAQTPEQVNAVVDYMVREMKSRELGYEDQIKSTIDAIGDTTGIQGLGVRQEVFTGDPVEAELEAFLENE